MRAARRPAAWWLRSGCRRRTENSRHRSVARPSDRPCDPSDKADCLSCHRLTPCRAASAAAFVVLVAADAVSGSPRVAANVQIVSQSVKHKILGRQAAVGRNRVRKTRSEECAQCRKMRAQGASSDARQISLQTAHGRMSPAQSHEAKRSILNFFATALGSASDPAVTAALRRFARSAARRHPRSSAVRSGSMRWARRSSMRFRPICSISTTPISIRSFIPAAPVAAPVLALAEARKFSGRDRADGIHSRRGSGVPHRQRGLPGTLCARLAYHLDLRRFRRRGGLCEAARAFGGRRLPTRSGSRRASRRGSSKIFRVRPRMSASAMPRATACSRHCSRPKAMPLRRGPSKGRSAGRAPWETSPIIEAPDRRSRQDLGDREEYLQALSGRHRVPCRDRRLFQTCGRSSAGTSMRSCPSRCKARRCCWRAATVLLATSAMRASASIIARPARCCWARPVSWSFSDATVFRPEIVALRQKVRAAARRLACRMAPRASPFG